nr:hypothetical protein [uncultured Kingella sp.]
MPWAKQWIGQPENAWQRDGWFARGGRWFSGCPNGLPQGSLKTANSHNKTGLRLRRNPSYPSNKKPFGISQAVLFFRLPHTIFPVSAASCSK